MTDSDQRKYLKLLATEVRYIRIWAKEQYDYEEQQLTREYLTEKYGQFESISV